MIFFYLVYFYAKKRQKSNRLTNDKNTKTKSKHKALGNANAIYTLDVQTRCAKKMQFIFINALVNN